MAGLQGRTRSHGIAAGPSGIAVANSSTSAITLFGSAAAGNTAPASTISGAATGLSGTHYVAFVTPPFK